FEGDAFFTTLLRGKLDVINAEVGALEDKPVEILTAHAAGDDAYDLLWSGLIPDAPTNALLGTRMAPNLARSGRPKPEMEVGLAFWLDPATSHIHQVKMRCYTRLAANPPGAAANVAPGVFSDDGSSGGAAGHTEQQADKDAKAAALAFEN